ncbi:phosphoadenylyl-sulfate reductase [Hyphomonas sp.]|uniref:phosphoadenylyl-sulfate reductase n=1 Tax=Hyphomonas sp. TaxID=87 RepID=UPI0035283036
MTLLIDKSQRPESTRFQDARAIAIQLNALSDRYESLSPTEILADALQHEWFDNSAVVSSFGAESAVLLHMVSQVAPELPVLLIDTGKLFGETRQYAAQLQHRLGLEDVRHVAPRRAEIDEKDPLGKLSGTDPDSCCALRKTIVLQRALEPFGSWINGRKRHQTDQRSLMSIVERDGDRIKLNPLANFSHTDIADYHRKYELPDHPLISKGYRSIGCFPCTSKVGEGENPRSGRWPGLDKTECGIH